MEFGVFLGQRKTFLSAIFILTFKCSWLSNLWAKGVFCKALLKNLLWPLVPSDAFPVF